MTRIAQLADTDISLTRRAIANLLYYGCVLLLDIFSFSAIYAPTAEIAVFFADEAMQDECRRYVATSYSPFGNPPDNSPSKWQRANKPQPSQTQPPPPPSRSTMLDLYSTLRQGLMLRDWCIQHNAQLSNIDVRRLITFGVIKGFLYRVHKYTIASKPTANTLAPLDDPIVSARMQEKAWRKAAMSSGWQTPTTLEEGQRGVDGLDGELPLEKYLDGMHCLDEVCSENRISEREAVKRLRGFGDVVLVCR